MRIALADIVGVRLTQALTTLYWASDSFKASPGLEIHMAPSVIIDLTGLPDSDDEDQLRIPNRK